MKDQKLKFMPADPSSAPEKARIRNTEKSNIGRALCSSASTKAMRLTSAVADDRKAGQAGEAEVGAFRDVEGDAEHASRQRHDARDVEMLCLGIARLPYARSRQARS